MSGNPPARSNASPFAAASRWRVVGGTETGGLLVRSGVDVGSPKEESRLSTGATLLELELRQDRLNYSRLTGTGPKEGWISIVGVGGKVLAERITDDTAPATGFALGAKGKGKAPNTPAGELNQWLRHAGGERGSFEVALDKVMVRSLPSVKSAAQPGILKKGDVVEGEIRDEWLLVSDSLSDKELEDGKGKWVLIDGTSLGIGVGKVLEPYLPEPEVKKEFGTALEVLSPPIGKDRARCVLEVEMPDKKVKSIKCAGRGKVLLVQELEVNSEVKLRFVLSNDSGTTAKESKWTRAHTADVREWQEGDELEMDLLGRQRGKCSQCSCPAFLPDLDNVSQNSQVSEARCLYCGCNCMSHPIVEEAPAEQAGPKAKAKADAKALAKKKEEKRQAENLLIDHAVSLPLDSMMCRWASLDMKAGQKEWPRLSKNFKEVVAWSDLHSDMGQNMEHLLRLPEAPDTVLIVAGDIATNMDVLESSLALLKQKFGEIFYVPGNHELWVAKKDGLTSLHKFLAILELCERLDVQIRPAFISENCAVCPLFTWYKDNLFKHFKRDKADIPFDIQTQWPWDISGRGDTNDAQQPEITDLFLSLNARRLESAPKDAVEAVRKAGLDEDEEEDDPKAIAQDEATQVITFSHFVPRQECYPGPRRLCGVMGCTEIEDQLRRAGGSVHIFGHSHIAVDREIQGVRYVQHPLGYPNDYHRKSKPMRVWFDKERGKDLESRRRIALAEDGKWFVWNVMWYSCNNELSKATTGAAQKQYASKSTDDEFRADKHWKNLQDVDALSYATLMALREQVDAAGFAAAALAMEGYLLPAEDMEAMECPSQLEPALWKHMFDAIVLAAQAVNCAALDTWVNRKGDEHFEFTHENYHLAVNDKASKEFQAQFEQTWGQHVAPDPEVVKELERKSRKRPKDPEKAREIALGGDGKWFVWNTIWYATNSGMAKFYKGPAHEEFTEKATEDLGRADGHWEQLLDSGAFTEETLYRLKKQSLQAGEEAAQHTNRGEELLPLKVKALEPPGEIDQKKWNKMVQSVRTAAQATNAKTLDPKFMRNGNERWTMTHENYPLLRFWHKGNVLEKRFESLWHNHVAPDPGEDWSGATAVPDATINKIIVQELADRIKKEKKKFQERPPGRWTNGDIWDASESHLDANAEAKTQKLMNDEMAAWSTQTAAKDVEIEIFASADSSQSIKLTVSNELTVKHIKEEIVHKVGRGPASKIILTAALIGTLDDSMLVSSIEEDITDGIRLSGIDMGSSKLVQVKVVHATITTVPFIVVTVKDTSSILDVRREVMERIGEIRVSTCKIVRRSGDAFLSLKDNDRLNGRTELLFMGRGFPAGLDDDATPEEPQDEAKPGSAPSAPAAPAEVASDFLVTVYVDRDMDVKSEVTATIGMTIRALKERIASEDPTGIISPDEFSLKLPDSDALTDGYVISTQIAELEIC